MNKKELVQEVAGAAELPRVTVERALDVAMNVIRREVYQGGRVALSGFGRFEAQEQAARKARNPNTGEEIDVPPRKKVKFKAYGEWFGA